MIIACPRELLAKHNVMLATEHGGANQHRQNTRLAERYALTHTAIIELGAATHHRHTSRNAPAQPVNESHDRVSVSIDGSGGGGGGATAAMQQQLGECMHDGLP